ncbi:repC-binding protein A [Cavenderia fasciculata]|uniref:RepC-binding protein A n=1 Tax=Cavenderia fasciculata TaxID=261658 RepID=F4QDT4_CACFS|nr:repC-binding protein A [Cavenderia fasciculata]EGG13881.1 repC-binding protein A [Cavenderia fasciculata]|eukprot:XP_004350589.1 repC-binding protein A [Cavenderia fasciculata]
MKITIKNINKEVYTFDVTGDESVTELKQLIQNKHSHQASWQTLIYGGKVLENDNKLSTYNITENGFLVCMVKKPKEETVATTAPAVQPATTPVAPTSAPSTTPASTSTPTNTPAPTPSPASSTSPSGGNSSFIVGPEYEAAITNLMEMSGANREMVIRALRASFNNAERAADILLSGAIPADEDEDVADDDDEDVDAHQEPPLG